MKKILLIILSVSVFQVNSQKSEKPDDFHRLLVFNNNNELMVVKIKGTDFWVTPGLYSQTNETTKGKLTQLGQDYNLSLSKPDLKGVFILKNKQTKAKLTRYFYKVKASGETKLPDNIESIKWLPIEKAYKKITFPHINLLLKQISDHPQTVWAGSILRYKEDGGFKAKMLTEFYPFTGSK